MCVCVRAGACACMPESEYTLLLKRGRLVQTRAGVWSHLPGRPGVALQPIFALQRDGRLAAGAPAGTPLKSDTFVLSDVTCQGVVTLKYLLLPCLKYCICPAPLYLHDLAFCSIVHSHKNLLECLAKASYSVLWFLFILSICIVSLFVWGRGSCQSDIEIGHLLLIQDSDAGLQPKPSSAAWNQGPVALLVTQIQTVV